MHAPSFNYLLTCCLALTLVLGVFAENQSDRPLVVGTVTIPRPSELEYENARAEVKTFEGDIVPQRQRSLIWVARGNNSAVRLVASAAGFPNLRLDYFTKNQTASTTDETQAASFSYRFAILGLVEIQENTLLDDTFTPFLGSSRWNNVVSGSVSMDNTTIKTAVLSSQTNAWPVNQPNLSVSLTLYAVPKLINTSNLVLLPGSFKFDVKIEGYEYKSGNGTTLGFVTGLWTNNAISSYVDGKRVSITRAGLATLDWVDTVDTDKGAARIGLLGLPENSAASDGVEDIIDQATDGDREDDRSHRHTEKSKRLVFKVSNVTRPTTVIWDPSMHMDTVSLDVISATNDLGKVLEEAFPISAPTSTAFKALVSLFALAVVVL